MGYKGTHKPRAAPTLRRDPPAQSKLQILLDWCKRCDEHGVKNFVGLPSAVKRELQQKWHWHQDAVKKWLKLRPALEKKIATARLGKNGLRACGHVRRATGKSKSEGARLTHDVPGLATPRRPLEGVMHRIECWFKRERQHGHEVRRKTILTRTLYELEFEKDKQTVLRDTNHKSFNKKILKRVTERLDTFKINSLTKKDGAWVDETLLPRLRANGRKGQRLSEQKNKTLNWHKAKLTWATADRFQHIVARGSSEDLHLFVGDPEAFAEKRKDTSLVVVDATALWLKLRGEEKVYIHEDEIKATSAKARIQKLRRKFREKQDAQDKAAYEAERDKWYEDHPDSKAQVDQMYSSAGDKYRLTLINISAVEGWFDPSKTPTSAKKRSVLLVPCARHCKVSDMDLEAGTWARDVTYQRSDGETEHFKAGEPLGALLKGWRSALLEFPEADRARVFEAIDVWGQPRAWTDELIASWTIDFIKEQHGQSLVFADCLSSQWTEAVTLRAWLQNVVYAPMAPDVTSFLQEPDTHEHSQLKATIREVKAEMHWQLEQEWLQKVKAEPQAGHKYPSSWGPYECLYCVSEAYTRFREKNKDAVPLQGLQANQMLAVRPTDEGELKVVTGDEPWSYSVLPGRGIEPHLAKGRIEAIQQWPENVPPVPDWSVLDGECFRAEDLPKDYDDDENPCLLELGALDLELTDEQKDMLRTPEERIKELKFPQALQNRVKLVRKCHRKNRWASKFQGQNAGKLSRKWQKAKKASGGEAELQAQSRGVAKAKVTTFAQRIRAKLKSKRNDKTGAKKKGLELEPCKESPWHGTRVRVTEECVNEGRHGPVKDVWRVVGEEDTYQLRVLEALRGEGGGAG